MLKIRGISNAENLLTDVNRFGHCLTIVYTETVFVYYSAFHDQPQLQRVGRHTDPYLLFHHTCPVLFPRFAHFLIWDFAQA